LRFRDGVGDLGEERLGASRIENLLRGLEELASPIDGDYVRVRFGMKE